MDPSGLRSLAPAGDQRGRWTLVAAGGYAGAGLVAALLGAAFVLVLGVIYGARGPIGPVGATLGTGIVLWFVAPAVGGALVGGTAWALLVESLGRRVVVGRREWAMLIVPGLGGLAGVLGGLGLHFVTWEAVVIALTVVDGPVGPGLAEELAGAVLAGAYVGLSSVLVGGVVTVPALGLAGVLLGAVRHLATDDRPNREAGDWDRSGGVEN